MQRIQQFIAPPVPYAAVLRDRITASKTPMEQPLLGTEKDEEHTAACSQLSRPAEQELLDALLCLVEGGPWSDSQPPLLLRPDPPEPRQK